MNMNELRGSNEQLRPLYRLSSFRHGSQ
jgi:hypothetical protein